MPNLFSERYAKLNTRQKQAVDTIDGPVLVVAGPGSGKTELLSLRVANILLKADIYPSNILCLTFTESAALNMRQRLAGLIGEEAYKVAIHTFHSFGTEVINRHPDYFYEGAIFLPADELAQIELLETIFNSLSHDNPLRSEHPDQGFVYLKETSQAISALKKAGLTPEEFKKVLQHNADSLEKIKQPVHQLFDQRLTPTVIPQFDSFIQEAGELSLPPFPVSHIRPLIPALLESLEEAAIEAKKSGKTAPLSSWKEKNITKDPISGQRILKDQASLAKLMALADIYAAYQAAMHAHRYIDFDDMLLSTIQVLENNEVLRSELQEQYQYLLVDEFQDTNDAQMRLLRLLTNAEVNEGRPNIMAVGDDDQAVYKFQGAEISNILNFRNSFVEPVIITLTDNYRSTQAILDTAREVILKGGERLENLLPEVEKTLVAANKALANGNIIHHSFLTREHEYFWIAKEIRRQLDNGSLPENIAIIARQHRDLEAIVPYLHQENIAIKYDRQQNVLKEQHIHQLIQMARFICSLSRQERAEADHYLPEILSYPFWEISRQTIWDLAVCAFNSRSSWLQCMLEHQNQKLVTIANFFIDLSVRSTHEPLEYILKLLIGADPHIAPNSEEEDIADKEELENSSFSPFKRFYFSPEQYEKNKIQYLTFLSSLKVFIQAIREYRPNHSLLLEDVLQFVDIHEKNNISVTDTSPFINGSAAVPLLTAHKSKGLEFETVFVLNCQDEVWAGRGNSRLLRFPANLPITPAGDTIDDQLRLFYVALTRAKRHLYLTSYSQNDESKDSLPLHFLSHLPATSTLVDEPESVTVLSAAWEGYHSKPRLEQEDALLKPLVENYILSVTHLNNFLDVTRGGPQTFLEQNLLRFPQPKSVAGSFGSAIHASISRLQIELKKNKVLPSLELFLHWFQENLQLERLNAADFALYLERGSAALSLFYIQKKDSFSLNDETERDFRNQNVMVGDVQLQGKIDRIIKVDSSVLEVHDYKTGKPATSWTGSTPHEKVKLWSYRRQLLFYKLLIEHSREYSGKYTVNTGVLEFVEPEKGSGEICDLTLEIESNELKHLKELIQAVATKICSLDFPDVSRYSQDLKGIQEFEEDLINGRI